MKLIWMAVAVLLLAGCGVQPSGVTDGGAAPTGVAPGVTLYFVDAGGELRPQLRETDRLGSISAAMSLLLLGPGGFAPGDSDLHTEIASGTTTLVEVTVAGGVIELRVPLAADEVTALGVDQLVCTALGTHVQGGGSRNTKVRILFTLPTPDSDRLRTCPLIR